VILWAALRPNFDFVKIVVNQFGYLENLLNVKMTIISIILEKDVLKLLYPNKRSGITSLSGWEIIF
jgi:hypothetical protein